MDENFTLTHMTSYKQSKNEWFKEIKDEQMRYFGYEIDSVEISQDGDTAVLLGRSKTDAGVYGMHYVWNLELKMPMKRQNGK